MTWLWVPCHSAAYRSSPGKRQISPVSRRRENKPLTSASQRPQGTDKHPNESENDIHFLCHFDDAAANRSTDILSFKPLFGIYLLFVICYSERHLGSALSVITFSRFKNPWTTEPASGFYSFLSLSLESPPLIHPKTLHPNSGSSRTDMWMYNTFTPSPAKSPHYIMKHIHQREGNQITVSKNLTSLSSIQRCVQREEKHAVGSHTEHSLIKRNWASEEIQEII